MNQPNFSLCLTKECFGLQREVLKLCCLENHLRTLKNCNAQASARPSQNLWKWDPNSLFLKFSNMQPTLRTSTVQTVHTEITWGASTMVTYPQTLWFNWFGVWLGLWKDPQMIPIGSRVHEGLLKSLATQSASLRTRNHLRAAYECRLSGPTPDQRK